ncbi:MAG: PAS domain-containing protein [Candidatus Saccharimonadales bacterium]
MSLSAPLPADHLISSFHDSATDSIKVLDVDGTVLSFNPAGYDLMELDSPTDVIGKSWLSLWMGDTEELAKSAIKEAGSGKSGYFEAQRPTKKGTLKWWQVTLVPLKNSQNDIEWILVISRDVSELHELRKENKKLKKDAVKS